MSQVKSRSGRGNSLLFPLPNGEISSAFQRQNLMERVRALAAPSGKRGKRVVAEFDLEDPEGKRDAFTAIVPGDAVIVRAGGSFAEIVFTGLNERGLLACMAFKKNEPELPSPYEIDYAANGEPPTKVLEGRLADDRKFEIKVARLPFYHSKEGAVANVDISVVIEGRSTFDQFGLRCG